MRGRRRGFGGLLGLAAVAATLSACAAEVERVGRIEGVVVNVLGEAVPAAAVSVTDQGGVVLASTTTDGVGMFQFAKVLVAERWTVRATGDGWAEARSDIVPERMGHVARLVLRPAATVSVTVVDGAGAGVAGAEVVLADPRWEVRFETTGRCDADGRVKFERVPLGLVDVAVSAKGMELARRFVLLRADEAVTVTLQAGDGVGLRVEIDGLPAGARVTVGVEGWSKWWQPVPHLPPRLRSVTLDARGRGVVEGLPEGGMVIRPSGEGFAFEPREIRFDADASERVARFRATVLRPTVARGRLVDEQGVGIAGETVEFAEPVHASAVTGADGSFAIRSFLQPGELFLAILPTSGWVMAQDRLGDPSIGGSWRMHQGGFDPEEEIVLVATRATVWSGRVVGSEGEPRAYEEVYLYRESGGAESGWDQITGEWTDADGRFSFPRHRPHFGRFCVRAEWLSGGFLAATTERAGEVDVGEMRLPGGTVTGVVRDGDGKAVAGARVWLNGWDRSLGTRRVGTSVAFTDREGRYRFAGVAAGDFGLVAGWHLRNTRWTDVEAFGLGDGETVVMDMKAGDLDEVMSGR